MTTAAKPGTNGYSDTHITDPSKDRLNRRPFVDSLAHFIRNWPPETSAVVGIYGRWGEGKTSVLQLLKRRLELGDDAPTVLEFNPWYFTGTQDLVAAFFTELETTLQDSDGGREDAVGALRKYAGKVLGVAPSVLRLAGKVGGLIVPGAAAGADASASAAEWIASLVGNDNGASSTIAQLKGELHGKLRACDKKIVVFIDDIDRMDSEEICCIFKLVKLCADFPNTVYVLAFDPDPVAKALAKVYPDVGSQGEEGTSRKFLEKIVQMGVPLPPTDKSVLRTLVIEELYQAVAAHGKAPGQKEKDVLLAAYMHTLDHCISTLRQGKRYLNVAVSSLAALWGRVNPWGLFLMEGLRVFFPKVYRRIPEYSDYVVKGIGAAPDAMRVGNLLLLGVHTDDLPAPSERQRVAAHFVTALFPATRTWWRFEIDGPTLKAFGEFTKINGSKSARDENLAYFHSYFYMR